MPKPCAVTITALPTPLIAYRQHGANQIGIPYRGMHHGKTCAAIHGPQVLRFEAALTRLREVSDRFPVSGHNLQRLEETLIFRRACAGLPDARWRRLPGALRELAALRYHRYARGLKSFRKDLLR